MNCAISLKRDDCAYPFTKTYRSITEDGTKVVNVSTIFLALVRNWYLLLFTFVSLFLFTPPIPISLVLSFFLFIILVLLAIIEIVSVKIPTKTSNSKRAIGLIMVFAIALSGLSVFYETWTSSDKAPALASALGVTTTSFIMTTGSIGCAIGFIPCINGR